MNTHPRLRLLFVLATSAALANAQGLQWTQMLPPHQPAVRGWHAMAFDAARQQGVLHGGYTGGTELGDTWTWDGLDWTAQPQAALPTRRWHAMAYDAARQRVVMYGGQSAGSYPTATYLWDGTNWTTVTTTTHPGLRAKHAMAYDAARQRVVLYGGVGFAGSNNTWEWDGTAWLLQSPAQSPPERNEHAMAYDAARQRTVLFGGQLGPAGNFAYVNDVWEWDGATWHTTSPAVQPPTPRYPTRAFAYDASRQRIVLFSGHNSLADTWTWDGQQWTQLAAAPAPLARQNHSLIYDETRQTLVLFGGSVPVQGQRNDTWITQLVASATAFGSGCGTPALGLVPDPNARPVLGQTAVLTVTDVPHAFVALAAGWDRNWFGSSPLPMSLAIYGMPSCDLLQSTEIAGIPVVPATATTSSYSLALPNIAQLLGLHLYLQAYSLAPGQNSLGMIVSNGVDWVFGAQ